MMPQAYRFPILIVVSLIVFIVILRFVMRRRDRMPTWQMVTAISIVVVPGGMLFAKLGNNSDWPWWIYYGVPAVLTWLLPPFAFRLSKAELWKYLVLAVLSAPAIHVAFSFFLGWHDYMPFIPVPSLHHLLTR